MLRRGIFGGVFEGTMTDPGVPAPTPITIFTSRGRPFVRTLECSARAPRLPSLP